MKKRLTIVLTLLLCCALLCACGKQRETETVYLPASATPVPTPVPTPTPAPTPTPMPENEQRALLDRCRSIWAWPEPNYDTWFYAYTDMDHNGRLEVLTASLQGTGLYTYVNCWEVSPDYTGVVQCPDDTREGQAWPDIILDSIDGYYDPTTGRYSYVCDDLTRDGAARYYRAPNSFSLQNGRIEVRVLSSMEEIFDASGSSVKNYYNAAGSPISEAEYNAAASNAFAGQERTALRLSWTQVDPQPQAASTPVYQSAAPVVITKHPTSESLSIGGRTWFIAHANNATSLTWETVDPQGRVFSLNEAMGMNPGLELEALEEDTLAVRNAPLSLNGWGVRARFDGPGGSAVTNQAMIYVSDYESVYAPILTRYYNAYINGRTDPGYAYENGISEFIGYSTHVGYAIKDVDKDGVPELMIFGMGTDDFSDGVMYDFYTLLSGQPQQIACSSARNRYYLRGDNRVYNEGSSGAGHSVFVVNRLVGGALYPEESAFTYFDGGPDDGYYYQADGCTYTPRATDVPISEAEFGAITGNYQAATYVPQLTQIA